MDIIFGVFSVTSIVSGTLAAVFIRKFNRQAGKDLERGKKVDDRKFVTNNQLGMVVLLTIYDVALLVAKYFEVYAHRRKVSRWDGEWYEGWFQFPVFLTLDLAIVNGAGWTLWLWARLAQSRPKGLTRRFFDFFNPARQVIMNRVLVGLALIGNIVFAILFNDDPGRLYLYCCLLMILFLAILFLFMAPMAIDLFFLIFHIKSQNRITANSQGSSTLNGVIRVFVTVLVVVILSPTAIFVTITTTVFKRSDRLTQSLTPMQVNAIGDGIFTGSGITITILIYSLFALIMSIPFLFRREFIPTITGKTIKSGATKTDTSATSNIKKSGNDANDRA